MNKENKTVEEVAEVLVSQLSLLQIFPNGAKPHIIKALIKAIQQERKEIVEKISSFKQQWGGAIDERSADFAESETKRRIIKRINNK